jgi:septum formation protein
VSEQLILASASPRRRELLDQIGMLYIVQPVDIDETPFDKEVAVDYVKRVAAEKSRVCFKNNDSDLPVLAADTSVVIDGNILGKPTNKEHAVDMLKQLSGQTHSVYTAVSVRSRAQADSHDCVVSKTEVTFRALSAQEIERYWQTCEPKGKAGAYAIQGMASIFVKSIKGSFSGVVGLPLFETAGLLSKHGIEIIK